MGFVIYDMMSPQPVNWVVTFGDQDKNPFGAFILNERSPDLFPEEFEKSFNTLSQINDEENILILSNRLKIEGADLKRLFELLNNGTNVFIGASHFNKSFSDTLGIEANFRFRMYDLSLLESDENWLSVNGKKYLYPQQILESYFEFDEEPIGWETLAVTNEGSSAITKKIGEGTITLLCNPLILTNFGMLYNENHAVVETLLSALSYAPVHYSKYYQSGRSEASTPLRYFLSQPPLRWSIYVSLTCLIVLLVIDSWRKQRKINIIQPPENTSLRYAQTLGGLFYREGNHFKTAMKIINHFFLEVRELYLLEPEFTDKFYEKLSGKTGVNKVHVKQTFALIQLMRKSPRLEESQLVELSKKIDVFK